MKQKLKRKAWNKGLTKESDERVYKNWESCKEYHETHEGHFKGKKHKVETIEKLKQNAGGFREGSGRGKSGWYKGYYCQSTYELVWTIYNLDHNIEFERNLEGFNYTWENKNRMYYPDFIVEGIVYELKGYETPKDTIKYLSVLNQNKKLVVLYKEDLSKYFDYVAEKYTYKALTELYEVSKHKNEVPYSRRKEKCSCGELKWKGTKTCVKCKTVPTKISWPNLDTLVNLVNKLGYSGAGRELGVTDNAIRGHLKRHTKQ